MSEQPAKRQKLNGVDTVGSILVVILAGALMIIKASVAKESTMVATDAAPLIYLAGFFYLTKGPAKNTLAWAVQVILILVAGGLLIANPTDVYWSSPLILAWIAAYFRVG